MWCKCLFIMWTFLYTTCMLFSTEQKFSSEENVKTSSNPVASEMTVYEARHLPVLGRTQLLDSLVYGRPDRCCVWVDGLGDCQRVSQQVMTWGRSHRWLAVVVPSVHSTRSPVTQHGRQVFIWWHRYSYEGKDVLMMTYIFIRWHTFSYDDIRFHTMTHMFIWWHTCSYDDTHVFVWWHMCYDSNYDSESNLFLLITAVVVTLKMYFNCTKLKKARQFLDVSMVFSHILLYNVAYT